jgi:hypothetical protein
MTRLHDLGLGQIWFPEENFDTDVDPMHGSHSGSSLAVSSNSTTHESSSASPASNLSQMTGSASLPSSEPWSLSPTPSSSSSESIWATKQRMEGREKRYSEDEDEDALSTGSSVPYRNADSGPEHGHSTGSYESEGEGGVYSDGEEEEQRGRTPYVKRVGSRTIESIERDRARWRDLLSESEYDDSDDDEEWTTEDEEEMLARGRSSLVKRIGNRAVGAPESGPALAEAQTMMR